jgi:hypothetical protein
LTCWNKILIFADPFKFSGEIRSWLHNVKYEHWELLLPIVTSSTGKAHSSGAHEFIPRFNWSSCWSICSLCVVFYRLLFVIWSFFLLSIISSVLLRLTASATHLLSTNIAYQEYTPLKIWLRIPLMARCTRYNITWYSLSVTCGRSVVFYGCPGSFHQ